MHCCDSKAETEINGDFRTSLNSSDKQSLILSVSVVTQAATCGYNNGSALATVSGGVAPYTYTLNGYQLNTGNFPQLSGGTYSLIVSDANGETVNTSFIINNSNAPPFLYISSYQRTSGCSSQDGSATLTASGGTPPYQYSIDNISYQSSNVFNNLYAGFHNFYVKDALGCVFKRDAFFASYFLNEFCPAQRLIDYIDFACTNDAFIHIRNIDAEGPYTYSLDGINYQSSGNFDNLTSGTYKTYCKSSNGTVSVFVIPIEQRCDIRINFITTDAACGQNNGILNVTAVNGIAPYSYTIDGVNYQISNIFTGLGPGNYYVSVKDAVGMVTSKLANVQDRCPMVTASSSPESCTTNDGMITATGSHGTPPYQFSLDGVNFQASNIFSGLTANSYTVTIKDAANFTGSTTLHLLSDCLEVSAISANSSCGNSNGSITATATGGTTPYLFSIDGNNFQSSGVFTVLPATAYNVTVKDATSRTATTNVTVANIAGPSILQQASTPSSCTANNNGTITLMAGGGTAPLQYSINGNNYQTSGSFIGLPSALYTVYVKDANQCITTNQVSILQNCINISTNILNETCGAQNGRISVSVSNNPGFDPYTYSLDGVNFQPSPNFSLLSAGSYVVTVKDKFGYLATANVNILNACSIVNATSQSSTCSSANGKIFVTASNGTPPYFFSIDNGVSYQANNIFSNVLAGNYNVIVKDINGVGTGTSVVVGNIPGPQINLNIKDPDCLNINGSIVVNNIGGTAPFLYSIDNLAFQSSNVFIGLSAINHSVLIRDVNGCIASQIAHLVTNSNLKVSTAAIQTICEGKNVIIVNNSNASSFSWTPSTALDHNNIKNPIAAPVVTTKYYVEATLGVCKKMDSVIIKVNSAPIPNTGSEIFICSGQDAQLHGNGGIAYSWSPLTYLNNALSANPVSVKPPSNIVYSLIVTDINGCKSIQSKSLRVNVSPPPIVFAGNDTSVNLNRPFQLSAIDINNSGFINYSWSPSTGLNNANVKNPIATILGDIVYKVIASTRAGCIGTDDILVKGFKGPDLYMPSAFTPNNDGLNDVLKVIPIGIRNFKSIRIFNRGGLLMFQSASTSNGWDGKYKSIPQETGVYVWIAEGIDDTGKAFIKKGTVTLIR